MKLNWFDWADRKQAYKRVDPPQYEDYETTKTRVMDAVTRELGTREAALLKGEARLAAKLAAVDQAIAVVKAALTDNGHPAMARAVEFEVRRLVAEAMK